MPVFRSQMYCRIWWSIYVLDRRLAIESGRPYLIQDSNVDTALPLELTDEWLSRFSTRTETTTVLRREIAIELASEPVTSIQYLTAMIQFSRVAGKAWELVYGIKASSTVSSHMVEYTDTILCNVLDNLPTDLVYNPNVSFDAQFRTRQRWQVKQTMLLFVVRTFLRRIQNTATLIIADRQCSALLSSVF